MTTIEGAKVRLRNKRMSDARDDYNWESDPELATLDAAHPINVTFFEFLSVYSFELVQFSKSRKQFAIETLEEKRHIGNCSYYNYNEKNRETEIGILIGAREYWNRGYGTDTLRSLVYYLFTEMKLERIYLKTLAWNFRAHESFHKCGFTEYGNRSDNGYQFILMEQHYKDWEERQRNIENALESGKRDVE